MNVYAVGDEGGTFAPEYFATLSEAHARAKELKNSDPRIEYLWVKVTQATVIQLLNAAEGFEPEVSCRRFWQLGPRGGLQETNAAGVPLGLAEIIGEIHEAGV